MLQFFQNILSIGVTKQLPILEATKVRLLNALTFLCTSLTFVGFIISVNLGLVKQAIITSSGIIFVFLPIYLLHHKGKYIWAKLHFTLFNFCLTLILTASAFSNLRFTETEDLLIGTVLIVVLIFEGRTKNFLSLIVLISYCASKWIKFSLIGLPHNAHFIFTMLNVLVTFIGVYIIANFFKKELKQAQTALHQRNKELNEKNEIIQEQNVYLEDVKDNLTQLNELKDKLFSILSHDLKSPFNSLKGVLGLFERKDISQEDFQMLISLLFDNLEQNEHLLDNLLNWSKSQLQGEDYKPTSFPITSVIQTNVKLAQNQAVKKDIEIELIHENQDLPLVWADYNMIDLIIRNLISNAIKFTPNQGKISVAIHKDDNFHAAISIKDTGVGMDEETLQQIQDKQIISSLGTQKEKGTGLGLLLTQEFIEKNKGKLVIESKPDEGSIFTVSIPFENDSQITA